MKFESLVEQVNVVDVGNAAALGAVQDNLPDVYGCAVSCSACSAGCSGYSGCIGCSQTFHGAEASAAPSEEALALVVRG